MGWDGMGWDGMGWDGMGWRAGWLGIALGSSHSAAESCIHAGNSFLIECRSFIYQNLF
jgi:hypothetical protein